MITGESLEYLCAVLNSKLITWLVRRTAVTTGMGLPQWDKFTVERIPIARPNRSTADEIRKIVRLMLVAIKTADEMEEGRLQRVIDNHFFEIYGLTKEEGDEVSKNFKF